MTPHLQRPLNIIIAGVGGQGVDHLTKSLWQLATQEGIKTQGSIFKGGAQTLGSIHSTLRLFLTPTQNYEHYSHQILEGDLDLLIALEPYEGLRFHPYFNSETRVISSSHLVPLWIERHKELQIKDPVKKLQDLGLKMICENFNELALSKHNNSKCAGLEMVLRAIDEKYLPFKKEDFEKIYWRFREKEKNAL